MTPDDQKDRHETGAARAAVETEAQAVPPGRAGVGRQRSAVRGRLPATGEVARLPRRELEGAGEQDDRPTAKGTARASAGCCISIAASATPSGNAAIPNTVHTKK